MKNIVKLFDYFKQAFHLNVENKRLYMPQIVLILIKTCLYLFFGIFLYQVMVSFGQTGFSEILIRNALFGMGGWIIGMVVFTILAGIVLEAGLYNMYKVCIFDKELISGEFFQGVRKNFFKFLITDIIMVIFWLLLLIPYIIVGVLSLLTGFVLIPLIVTIFTIMWKVSMVVEDIFVIEGLKRGFHFAVDNFIPLGLLVIIRESFLNIGNGSWRSNSSSGDSSESASGFMEDLPVDIKPPEFSVREGYVKALPYIRMGFYILLPVISIAIIVGSLVRMVFQIFFGLASFIMYVDNNFTANDMYTEVE